VNPQSWEETNEKLDQALAQEKAILADAAAQKAPYLAAIKEIDDTTRAKLCALVSEIADVEAECTPTELSEALEREPGPDDFDADSITQTLEEQYAEANDCFCRKCEDHQDSGDDVPDFSAEAYVIATLNMRAAGVDPEAHEAEQERLAAEQAHVQAEQDAAHQKAMQELADSIGVAGADVSPRQITYWKDSIYILQAGGYYGPETCRVGGMIGIIRPGNGDLGRQRFMKPTDLIATLRQAVAK
jgi:hypothetical protein